MKNRITFLCLFAFLAYFPLAQSQESVTLQKPKITLEDIWSSGKLSARTVPGFRFGGDDKSYLQKRGNAIVSYDITTGLMLDTLLNGDQILLPDGSKINFSGYRISTDGQKYLLETDEERIYRYSKRSKYYIWDVKNKTLQSVYDDAKQLYVDFSPDGQRVAFVADNNLYIKDLSSGSVNQITGDGRINQIINGASDWVYEEEFGLTQAFQWSPEGNFIGYIKFNESEVPQFTMEMYEDDLYPRPVTFKYPKVGEKNAEVSVWIYQLETGATIKADLGNLDDMYVPRISWANAPERLVAYKMNRHQNQLEVLLAHPLTGKVGTLLQETNPYYIDLEDIYFFSTKKWIVWRSERDGYSHLYLYDMTGRLIRQLTSGEFDVTKFYGIDEAREKLYVQVADQSPMRRSILQMDLNGNVLNRLHTTEGFNDAQFSSTYEYWVLTHSTINQAPTYTVYHIDGKSIRTIEDNNSINKVQTLYNVSPVDFFQFETSEGILLNGFMIKPADFDPTKQYPVFMFLYGGPNSQQVTDSWKGTNYWWFQHLAQEGYIVACVDNRGTGARGQDFRKITYMQLGHYETIDQIEAAKYLGNLPYTDSSRIGIYGWSYGGYMSSLCLLKGNDVFKAAIAVAPVTNWKWYDTIYTERYMRTERENPNGFKDNSPVYFADQLKGHYLLVHGMADDNVHFQHTVEMTKALIDANKQFDLYMYPNKNHGIYGGTARLHLFTKMTQFIKDRI